VSLAGKLLDVPARHNTLVTVTLGDTNAIDHLVLSENRLDRHLLLKQLVSEVNLSLSVATVNLDLENVSLLLANSSLRNLGVSNDADNLAVLLDTSKLLLRVFGLVGLLLDVLSERLLVLGLVPVFVHAAAELVRQVLGPHGGKRAQAAGSLDIANKTNNNHGGGLNDGHGLYSLLLVLLGAGLVDITDNVRHAGLVAHEGGKVAGLGSIIAGELPDTALRVRAPLAGVEAQGTEAGVLELPVGHSAALSLLARD